MENDTKATSPYAIKNVRLFIAFRIFFNARFYYPVFTILFLDFGLTMAQFALRWILMHDAVSCVIPGAKRPSQAEDNAAAADLPTIPVEIMEKVNELYLRLIKNQVHHLW